MYDMTQYPMTSQQDRALRSYRNNLGLYGAGTAIEAGGDILSGILQANGLREDARSADQAAAESQVSTAWQDSQLARQGHRILAGQQLVFDTAGVTLEGSAALSLAEADKEIALDRAMLRREGLKQYLGYRSQAKALRRSARASEFGGFASAFSTAMKAVAAL